MPRLVLVLMLLLVSSATEDAAAQQALPPGQATTCDLVEGAAAANGLPVDFFARLIWRESSFRAGVVSPVGAQGIAQFMPGTAAERGLLDPFDPLQAIPASAELLRSLVERFGNLGLAAAAYNSGARRIEEWLAGTGGLPRETRSYVAAITGRAVEEWRDLRASGAPAEASEPTTCLEVLAALDAPPLTAAALQAPTRQAEWQPWGAQVAGNFSQATALASYRRLQERHPDVLGDQLPLVVRKRNRSLGSRLMTHVRVPAPTRDAADEICDRLRTEGAPCVVLKN